MTSVHSHDLGTKVLDLRESGGGKRNEEPIRKYRGRFRWERLSNRTRGKSESQLGYLLFLSSPLSMWSAGGMAELIVAQVFTTDMAMRNSEAAHNYRLQDAK